MINTKYIIAVILSLLCLKTFATDLRPEHPRPDLYRENWKSLNGEWQFEIDNADDGESRGLIYGQNLNSRIVVPFCPESKLSGLRIPTTQHMKNVWYRRMFELPKAMKDKRLRVHFGGVDYKSWVYVNGQPAGIHVGGSAAFSFDITSLLKSGSNEIVVKVFDDVWSGIQPGGKQSESDQSTGVFYTRTTGIWQSVWLEAVGSSFVEDISIKPDPDNARVLIDTKINGNDQNLRLKVEAFLDGKLMGTETIKGSWQNSLVLNLKEKKLWAPGSPFLYDLKFTLYSGDKQIDQLKSYFGLRKISIEGRKVLINGKPIFQRLILDQGFYPDGLWTAPSDKALKNDIELSMAAGYNGARLHQKVFEPRFLYWADKLGYMVWGEYPNAGYNNQMEGFSAVLNEWKEILLRDRNHPSIVGWCAFNENFEDSGELQQTVWNVTKAIDPTRPALESSGWKHTLPNPDIRDAHDYTTNPDRLRKKWMDYFSAPAGGPYPPFRYFNSTHAEVDRGVPFMISEVGGIGWGTEGGWSYGVGPKTLDEFYARYKGTIDAMLDNPNLFGFCYTQLTDIEQEKNGLFYYDRKSKFDLNKIKEITSRKAAYELGKTVAIKPSIKTLDVKWKVLIGARQDKGLNTPYQYTVIKPNNDWLSDKFDYTEWKTGSAPFGHNHDNIGTEWTSTDLYLKKNFEYDGGELKNAAIVISSGKDADIYMNGHKIFEVIGNTDDYKMHLITSQIKGTLKKGTNTISVHTHQKGEGKYVDLAILIE